MTECALCGSELDTADRQSIRLSNTQPPWRRRSAGNAVAALGESFAAVIRVAQGEPEITLWFHRDCWRRFADLLQG
jgi:hypothetical protein